MEIVRKPVRAEAKACLAGRIVVVYFLAHGELIPFRRARRFWRTCRASFCSLPLSISALYLEPHNAGTSLPAFPQLGHDPVDLLEIAGRRRDVESSGERGLSRWIRGGLSRGSNGVELTRELRNELPTPCDGSPLERLDERTFRGVPGALI